MAGNQRPNAYNILYVQVWNNSNPQGKFFFFPDAEDQSFENKINTEKETCKFVSLPMP